MVILELINQNKMNKKTTPTVWFIAKKKFFDLIEKSVLKKLNITNYESFDFVQVFIKLKQKEREQGFIVELSHPDFVLFFAEANYKLEIKPLVKKILNEIKKINSNVRIIAFTPNIRIAELAEKQNYLPMPFKNGMGVNDIFCSTLFMDS